VICFESTSQTAALPCSCNVEYCTRCWDRALAESFNACDQARCPTCRFPVRVDFDHERGCLLFSREEADQQQLSPQPAPDEVLAIFARKRETVERLLGQARPMQVRLLRRYGAQHAELGKMAEAPEAHVRTLSAGHLRRLLDSLVSVTGEPPVVPPDASQEELARYLLEITGSDGAVAACWASGEQAMPSCVCGSTLRRVSRSERINRICELMFPGAPREDLLEIILSGQCDVICDICANQVRTSSGVWTCENGDSTILHATAYDVCDGCFVANTCREASDSAA